MNNNKENKYPTLKVIMLYPLLGGAIFCVIVIAIMFLILLNSGVAFSLEYFGIVK
ncbi:Uncharacterised protein [Moraxella lacunata]|uniref:Uncharacterized protein n=1 Tax=Moraxella lacunata TaxID=477 RepID=A0A378TQI0_MORLA|nr:hypothetical protein [Moraxella lacunata]STZ63046.1 Uncharacterised protein [Moraxella lacunata]